MSNSDAFDQRTGLEIAVIGMAGRFPGAGTVEQFWQNLKEGVESITFFSDQELRDAGVDPSVLSDANYVKAKGVLEDVEMFDALFFGVNPREAEIMDPQQRIFLECAWEALENSGYDSARYRKPIGVYAGVSANTYIFNLISHPEIIKSVGHYQTLIGNDKDQLATRVSYKLDLTGPSMSVQTACSTSLVAVHLACQSLLSGECSMALAGGVAATFPQKSGYQYQQGGISSPDGHCRAFDHKAQGTVSGNGVALVVLKRLDDALQDGDSILAIIKGSAINNDGSRKVGFTAPSIEGQAAVIRAAQMMAEVSPEKISYVEAHGTGTTLGDPIEVSALTQAFRTSSTRRQFCALGSVKTNIGHLDAAAGVAGLVKTVLALQHKELPPSLHYERGNEELKLEESPFYVNAELRKWQSAEGEQRRAGVSSFGIGGTNAHVILEEAPALETKQSTRPAHLLVLSAKTGTALDTATANLAAYFKAHPEMNLADTAHTLQTGRRAFEHRRAVVCRTVEDAARALETLDARHVQSAQADEAKPSVVMMFPGQGTQYVGMGRQLYESEPVFRQHVDHCAALLTTHLGFDLREVIFAEPPQAETTSARLNQTRITQPALFVIEYALTQLWMSWGVRPASLIGHSLGEYVAACVAGVMSLEDALKLVAARARLMQSLEPGAMLAVPLAEQEVMALLEKFADKRLSLAAVNAPKLCVVSGEAQAIEEFERELSERGVWSRRLQTSHAFHSLMMEPVLEEFTQIVKQIELRAPQLPYISNLSGRWMRDEEATDPAYWARHLRGTVRFAEGLSELLAAENCVLLEVGPGHTLGTLAKRQPSGEERKPVVLASMRGPHESQADVAFLWQTLGQLWMAGVEIDWPSFYQQEKRRRVPLPTYPFERQRYWIEAQPNGEFNLQQRKSAKKQEIADWFYVPAWKQSVVAPPSRLTGDARQDEPQHYLLFADECGIGEQLAKRLDEQGHRVTLVRAGEQFQKLGAGEYIITLGRREDYDALLADLYSGGQKPDAFIHLWNVTAGDVATLSDEQFEQSQQRGFYSLLFLAQALGEQVLGQQTLTQVLADQGTRQTLRLYVVSNNLQVVTGEEMICPEKATLLGPSRVIAQEYPHINCRSIDIIVPAANEKQLLDQLLNELSIASSDSVVAYRGQRRWVQTFEAVRIEGDEPKDAGTAATSIRGAAGSVQDDAALTVQNLPPRLRERGVYLITGGTGGIGLELAHYLAHTAQARLILLARTPLPERKVWAQWVATHGAEDETSRKLKRIEEIEAAGGEVLVVEADVADEVGMREAVREGCERFGKIDGVIHAAGVPGGGIIQLAAPEAAAAVLAPKVRGTRVLDAIFKDEPLDFILLFSSLRSILGGIGRVDYCAANAYLDAFARSRAARDGAFVCSIIWDGWQEAGMAVEATRRLHLKQEEGMLTAEGIEAFKRVLCGSWPEVVVSTEEFASRVERSNTITAASALEEAGKSRQAQPTHARLNLQTPYIAPRNEVEQTLAEIWQHLLGIEEVGVHDNFFELGGDSVLSIQIIAQANKAGLRLIPQQVFQHQTISELAAVAGSTQAIAAEQDVVTGRAPLTPTQRWFFDLDVFEPSHWNQSLMLEVREALDASLLEEAMAHLLAHHDALRMRFVQEEAGWIQINAPADEAVPFSHINLSDLPETGKAAAIEEAAAEAQASLDLTNGPLIRVVLLDLGQDMPGRLLLVAHHLVMDAISWRILLEDLGTVYEQLRLGKQTSLPPKTTAFKRWAERLAEYAQSDALRREADYWLAEERGQARPLPLDFAASREANTEGSARTLRVALSAEQTRALLQDVPQVYRTQINDLLLTSLAQAFNSWTGHASLLVDLEGHGRDGIIEDVDVTRTVGWFTTIFPVLLKVNGDEDAGSTLRHTKERLRSLPGRGLGYGLLRFLHADSEITEIQRRMPPAEVSFLYLGQSEQSLSESSPFVIAGESSGPTASPRARRSHLLMITGFVSGGQLQFDWTYSENLHRQSTIERLAEEYLKLLQELISHCLGADEKGYTPSDFPDAELSQEELDEIMLEFNQVKG